MADALLLASTRVEPRRLIDTGYAFRYQTWRAPGICWENLMLLESTVDS